MMETIKHTGNGWQARWFHFAMWLAILTAFILFLRAVEPILLPFVLGLFVAYLMDPLAHRLQRLGLSRSLSTAIITLTLFTLLTALIIWLAPILYDQVSKLLAKAPGMLHQMERSARSWAEPLLQNLNQLTGGSDTGTLPADTNEIVQNAVDASSGFVQRMVASGAALINVAALLLITPIVCFYLIRDWPSMIRKVDSMLPLAYAPTIREQLYQINRTLAAYLRGQITVMIFMSIFYIAGLVLVGLNFGLVLGLLAGCIIIVPYLGSVISVGLGLLIAYGQFDGSAGFWMVVAVYGAGQILESQILTPKIIGDRVGLHPLWMLFGMLAGAVLLGFVGVLLAVPLTAVIGVLVKFAVGRYLQSGLYLDL
ncbi:MAG: AI-2E family transporter [Pseudomonadota bacterium]